MVEKTVTGRGQGGIEFPRAMEVGVERAVGDSLKGPIPESLNPGDVKRFFCTALAGVVSPDERGRTSKPFTGDDEGFVKETAGPLIRAANDSVSFGRINVKVLSGEITPHPTRSNAGEYLFNALKNGYLRLMLATPKGDTEMEKRENQKTLIQAIAGVVNEGLTVEVGKTGGVVQASIPADDVERIKEQCEYLRHQRPQPAHPGLAGSLK